MQKERYMRNYKINYSLARRDAPGEARVTPLAARRLIRLLLLLYYSIPEPQQHRNHHLNRLRLQEPSLIRLSFSV